MSREINDMDEPSMLSSHSEDGQDAGAEGIQAFSLSDNNNNNNVNDMVDDEPDGDHYLPSTTRAFESSTSGEPMGDDSSQVSATTPKKKKSKKKKKKKKKKKHEHHEQEAKMEESFGSRTESSFDQPLPTNIQEYVPLPETVNDVPSDISYKDQGLSLEEIRERIRNASIHRTPIDVPSDISYKDQGLSLEEIRERIRNASIHRTPIDLPSQIDYKDQGLTLQELQQREIPTQRAIPANISNSQSTTPSFIPIAYARPLSLFHTDAEQGDVPLVPLNNETPSTPPPPPPPSVHRDSNEDHAVAEHEGTARWFGGKTFWKRVTLVGLLVALGLAVGIPLALSSRRNEKPPADIGTPTVSPGFEFVSATLHPTASSSFWLQVGQDLDGEVGFDFFGGSVTLSADGMTVAAGGVNSGHIRIYQNDSTAGQWLKLGEDLDGEDAGDSFGESVALSADGMTVAAGAPFNDAYGVESGHVRIYQYDSTAGQWLKLGQDLDGEDAGDSFGFSVALSADGMTVAAGGPYSDANGVVSGHVHIYQYDSTAGQWLKLGQDLDGEDAGDSFGFSVALSADGMTVAAGGPLSDANGGNSGHVRCFELINRQ